MATRVPETSLSQFSQFVASRMGLHFPKERWGDLERGLYSALQEHDGMDIETFIHSLRSTSFTRRQIELLASHLTVGETYFFREQKSFEILEEHILPELMSSRGEGSRSIRIWSAGCCTGEEPYSIAMTIDKAFPHLKDWNLTILATDLNPEFLRKASLGVYHDWSFRGTPPWVKERYFKSDQKGLYRIRSTIQRMVTFSYLNLAEDVYPSLMNNTNAMDIIFCRNVLMYFTSDHTKTVIHNLYRSLRDGGWLIVSPSEASQSLFAQFSTVNLKGAILYKKGPASSKIMQAIEFVPEETISETQPSVPPPIEMPHEDHTEEIVFPAEEATLPIGEEQVSIETGSTPYEEAVELYQRGRYEEAVEKIIGLLNKQSNELGVSLLVRILANQGKLLDAQQWCEGAIAADKLNPLYRYLFATILQEQGRYDEAVTSLKQALYLNHEFVLAYFALGNYALQRGDFKEAEKHFRNAVALLHLLRPDDLVPHSEGITAGRLIEIIESSRSLRTQI